MQWSSPHWRLHNLWPPCFGILVGLNLGCFILTGNLAYLAMFLLNLGALIWLTLDNQKDWAND